MAYSRWTNSVWYTFGTSKDGCGQPQKRSDWYFKIFCDSLETIGGFCYDELKKDIDKCLLAVKNDVNPNAKPLITEKEITELKTYMLEFVFEIERDCEN